MPRPVEPEALVRGLGRIFVPPREAGGALVDVAAACRMLRCDEDGVAALLAAGLPSFGPSGDRLRRFDVLNVGLYSGTGRTIPEIAEGHRVRFAAEPRGRWTEPRAWELAFELSCGRDDCDGGLWRLPPPSPERFGGAVEAWPRTPVQAGSPLRLEASVVVAGAEGAVESPQGRRLYGELVDDLAGGRLRYQYLPAALRGDPEAAAANGVLDCMAASLLLERRCRQAGLETRTRKGLLLGAATVEHVWLELRGAAGEWQPLDPILAALAARAGSGDALREFACGSVPNRLLPWALDADGDLLTHSCADPAAPLPSDQPAITVSAR